MKDTMEQPFHTNGMLNIENESPLENFEMNEVPILYTNFVHLVEVPREFDNNLGSQTRRKW